jgi:uncharacterized protein YbaR (Trm112 family)
MEAHFFNWGTTPEEMEKINREAGSLNRYFMKQYEHLAKQVADGIISPASLREIVDHTSIGDAQELLSDAIRAANRFNAINDPEVRQILNEFSKGIDILYRYLNLTDVKEGLLVCSKCNRWYPIGRSVEGIPELMPDELREEEEELAWLEKWKHLAPQKVLSEGKPFKLMD